MGREIDSIITYYNHYQVITENNKYILTEDGQKILTEQIKEESTTNITASDIYSSKVITHGDLLKTMMKEFDFEVKQDIKIGSIVSYKFGLKVNNSYEYADYGKFIVHSKEYNEDTKTYSYVAYDKMLFTMIPYVAEDISEMTGVYTLYDLVNYCCEYCDLELGVESFPNGEREITDDILKSLGTSNFTFRDILDYATEVTGCSSYILDEQFVIMQPNETNLILYTDSFKDRNVKFNEVFGPINSILFSRSEDTDVIEIKDDESIQANGVTQIKIKDNPFLEGNDRADYFEEMFDVLDGLTYSLNDVSSTGITYLEFNDKYKVSIDENEYDCLLLNDEINVVQGLDETIFTEEPQEKQQEYVTSSYNLDDVSFQVDKANRQIVLKVDSEGKLALAELKQNANNGTEFNVKADNIKLEGYTTINNGFSIDLNGNMTCNNANITGGSINMSSTISNPAFTLQSSEYPTLHTEITGGTLGIYELEHQSESVTVWGPRCAMGYSRSGGFSNLALWGKESYMDIGEYYLNDDLIRPIILYELNGGHITLTNSSGTATIKCNGTTGVITCTSVNPSLEENKKNIENNMPADYGGHHRWSALRLALDLSVSGKT